MSEQVLAAATIEVGQHPEWHFLGLTFNVDTIIGTLIAAAVLVGLGFVFRAKATSGVPGGVQLFFETVTKFMRDQIEATLGVRTAPYLVPLSIGLFLFILTCNWLAVLPLHHWEYFHTPTADVNLTYSLALLVFFWMHIDGARRHGGPGKQFLHVAKGHYPPLAPLWLLEQVTNTVALALRLFGNIFAGGIMISIFALLPAWVGWLPTGGWKLFELFVGAIHALIFVLLTIVYFSQSIGPEEEH